MNVTQLIPILKSRLWLIAVTIAVTVITAGALTLILPKQYEATTTLVIDFNEPTDTDATLPALLQSNYMETQLGILKSQHVALKVVDRFNMTSDPEVQALFFEKTEGQGSIRDWLANNLRDNINVTAGKNSRLVNVHYTAQEREYSAKMANAFAEAYLVSNLNLVIEPARKDAEWIDEQLAGLRGRLEETQSKLASYQQEKGIVASDQRLDIESERLKSLITQLADAETTFDIAQNNLAEAQKLIDKGMSLDAFPAILSSSYIQELKSELRRKETELAEISSQVGEGHPNYQRVKAKLSSLRDKLKQEIQTIVKGLMNNLQLADTRLSALQESQASQKAKVLELQKSQGNLLPLAREVENAQRNYDDALGRYQQYLLQSRMSRTNVTILSPAIPPIRPSSPKLSQNFAVALILGLALGVILAILLEMKERRVRTKDDLIEATGVPLVGSLEKG